MRDLAILFVHLLATIAKLMDFGEEGAAPDQFGIPFGLAVDSRDRTIVTDAWFDPETAAQGFIINVFSDIRLPFLAWLSYRHQ